SHTLAGAVDRPRSEPSRPERAVREREERDHPPRHESVSSSRSKTQAAQANRDKAEARHAESRRTEDTRAASSSAASSSAASSCEKTDNQAVAEKKAADDVQNDAEVDQGQAVSDAAATDTQGEATDANQQAMHDGEAFLQEMQRYQRQLSDGTSGEAGSDNGETTLAGKMLPLAADATGKAGQDGELDGQTQGDAQGEASGVWGQIFSSSDVASTDSDVHQAAVAGIQSGTLSNTSSAALTGALPNGTVDGEMPLTDAGKLAAHDALKLASEGRLAMQGGVPVDGALTADAQGPDLNGNTDGSAQSKALNALSGQMLSGQSLSDQSLSDTSLSGIGLTGLAQGEGDAGSAVNADGTVDGLSLLAGTTGHGGSEQDTKALLAALSGDEGIDGVRPTHTASPLQGAQHRLGDPAAANNQPPLLLTRDQGGDELADRLQMMMSKNLKHVDIRLDPPELGRLQIKLSINNDQASVQFTAANAQTRELIEQALPRLRELLSQQGVQLAQSSVQQESSRQFAGQQSQPGQDGQGNGSHNGNDGRGSDHLGEQHHGDVLSPQDFWLSQAKDGVDYYA
ncbi:flagellar hook-length control protein FliK, partial [Photobacterium aphoticum]